MIEYHSSQIVRPGLTQGAWTGFACRFTNFDYSKLRIY